MTRAECLAEHLDMTPKTHPWAYELIGRCNTCGKDPWLCKHHHATVTGRYVLNMPDPLASGRTADVWLGPLLRHDDFVDLWRPSSILQSLHARWNQKGAGTFAGVSNMPTMAIINAMLAADPAFAAKWEKCDE